MKKIKLLVVSTTLAGGGAEQFASTLVNHLDRHQFTPILALLRDEISYPLAEDVDVVVLNKHKSWHYLRAVRRLRGIIESHRPDIILSNIASTCLLTGMALRNCRHQPIWVARSGASPEHTDNLILRWLHTRYFQRADQFVAISRGLKEGFSKLYPFSRSKILTIYNFFIVNQTQHSQPLLPQYCQFFE